MVDGVAMLFRDTSGRATSTGRGISPGRAGVTLGGAVAGGATAGRGGSTIGRANPGDTAGTGRGVAGASRFAYSRASIACVSLCRGSISGGGGRIAAGL